MGARSRLVFVLRLTAILLPVALLLSGCTTSDPFNALTDRGEVSEKLTKLYYPVFAVAVVVFFLVEGLLLYTMIRFRRRPDSALPVQTHGNTRLEVGWTILPSVILAIIAVPTITTIVDLSHQPADALPVRVIGHQWWWEFRYQDPADPSREIITANEMHIPSGRRVFATIESDDVIHSFWVPNLAGKQDAIPGHRNDLWFSAREPGVYQGQCAEFCLDSHALMKFIVVAEPQPQFDQWLRNQGQPAPTATTGSVARGQEVFLGNACIGCHAIEGTAAQARVAPNLTHFGSRTTLGANRLTNTPENLEKWINNPPRYKPGAKMPVWEGVLSQEDIRAIVDYLESLK